MSSHPLLTRRDLLCRTGMGFATLGLAQLLGSEGPLAASAPINPLRPRAPHFPAKAQRVIHLFMNGGPSHVDTFDPKPLLLRYAGRPLPRPNPHTERRTGVAFPTPFRFKKYGKGDMEISDLFPHVARCADELCIIRSM